MPTCRDFSWFSRPSDGGDAADARALAEAINCLDAISFRHRTDAFRLLAARYREDLERMKREDALDEKAS